MTQRPWSKLQREIYDILTPTINLQIHCTRYPMRSQNGGSTDLPRYWITLDKNVVWDYPKDFIAGNGGVRNFHGETCWYPYLTDICSISDLLREYIDTPKAELLTKQFTSDKWGLVNILRAADRRIGMRRLDQLQRKTHNIAALKIIARRSE
ncbi:hypothetical protein HZS97_17625 [Shigella flexneri]|uniref:SF0329 family protein n=1 Tax=Shigella flexneri TaxID=623 RepID=UPI002541FE1E|nr:hypothetical protein [Shigella flexneri]UMV02553.1 hypothetical protein HZS97_17625 [Shigella flexneri]